jgi:formylmethanofuran dehydrogenase subunit E
MKNKSSSKNQEDLFEIAGSTVSQPKPKKKTKQKYDYCTRCKTLITGGDKVSFNASGLCGACEHYWSKTLKE